MAAAELRALALFDGLDDLQLGAFEADGETVCFAGGEVLFRFGDPAADFWVILEGEIELLRPREHGDAVVVAHMSVPGTWAGGFQAWTDSGTYMATGRGSGPGRVFRLPAERLGSHVQAWFPFGVHLIQGIWGTVRAIEAQSRQREELVALGTLTAGLAHEINNPAAAATRSATALRESTDDLLASLAGLAAIPVSAEQFLALDELRRGLDRNAVDTRSLAFADREEAVLEWLEARGVETAWKLAPTLAASGADLAWCERALRALGEDALEHGVSWVASTEATANLLGEVTDAVRRISGLVAAVKSYTTLDRSALEEIDVTEGLERTVTMLAHLIGDGIAVVRAYDPGVPRITALPGELDQVWTNLITNAVDAMGGEGVLRLTVSSDAERVTVEVADTGPGMPPEVQARAFEPFFTTKDVGRGTGLGLDISRRIAVDRHGGEIVIDSKPGATAVRVHLPALRSDQRA